MSWDLLQKILVFNFNSPFPQRVAATFFFLAKAFRPRLPFFTDTILPYCGFFK